MNFSKAKSFFIALFIILDLMLLFFYIKDQNIISVNNSDNFQRIVKILEKKSIKIENNANNIIDSNALYNLSLLNTSSEKGEFLSSVLGEYKEKDNAFISDKGKIVFEGNSFIFYPKEKEKITSLLPSQKTSNEVLKTIDKYGFNTSYLSWYSTLEEEKDLYKITYKQNFYKKELFNWNFTAYVTKDGIEYIKGCLFSPLSVNSRAKNIKSTEEILIRFSNLFSSEKKIIITKINNGYYIKNNNFKTLTAIPALEISTKNGDFYYFDLLNGEFLEKLSIT